MGHTISHPYITILPSYGRLACRCLTIFLFFEYRINVCGRDHLVFSVVNGGFIFLLGIPDLKGLLEKSLKNIDSNGSLI